MRRMWLVMLALLLPLAVPVRGQPATTRAATTPAVPVEFRGPPGGFVKDAKTGAINKVHVEGAKPETAWFHLAVPKVYTPEKQWPLVLVLHGGPGGNGPDDIVSFFRGGLMAQGVISVYPNAVEKQLLAFNYPLEGANMLAIIKQVAATYRVDPCRIYLVGVSMGGGGAWANGAVLRDMWAGIGPISGWYQPTPAPPPEWLQGMPIYCLHGAKDQAVPISRSELALASMKKVGHTVLEVKDLGAFNAIGKETMVYRAVPDAPHNVLLPWETRGRQELSKMLGWLLKHQRATPADIPAAEKALAEWGRKFNWKPGGTLGAYDAKPADR